MEIGTPFLMEVCASYQSIKYSQMKIFYSCYFTFMEDYAGMKIYPISCCFYLFNEGIECERVFS